MRNTIAVAALVASVQAEAQETVYFLPGWCPRPAELNQIGRVLEVTMNGCCLAKGRVRPNASLELLGPYRRRIGKNDYTSANCDGVPLTQEEEQAGIEYEDKQAQLRAEEDQRRIQFDEQEEKDGLWPPVSHADCDSSRLASILSRRGLRHSDCLRIVVAEGAERLIREAREHRFYVTRFGLWSVNSAGGAEPYAEFINPDPNSNVKYIDMQLVLYNAVGDQIRSSIGGQTVGRVRYTGPLASADGPHEARWEPVWYNHSASCIEISSVRVEFLNKKVMTFTGPAVKKTLRSGVSNDCRQKGR